MNVDGTVLAVRAAQVARPRARLVRGGCVLLLALGLLGGVAASAQARDICMDYSGGGALVWKRFKIPGKNRCTALQGLERISQGGALTGMACTSASGDWVTLNYTSHDYRGTTSYFEVGTCRMSLPLQPTGNQAACAGTYISTPGGTGRFSQPALMYFCDYDIPD